MTTRIYSSNTHFAFSENPFRFADTLYRIEGDLLIDADSNGQLPVAANCILSFEGGSVELVTNGMPGTICLNKTNIDAPHYHIFKNCALSAGLVNIHIPVAWFGAVGDGATDDSQAIYLAVASCHGNIVLMDNLTYFLSSSVLIDESGTYGYGQINMECPGTIKIDSNIPAFSFKTVHDSSFVFNHFEAGNGTSNTGIALAFNGNFFNNTVKVNTVRGFKNGLLLAPRRENDTEENTQTYAGIQYCKFSFNLIDATYGIHMDMTTNATGHLLWVNENQFTGGRLQGSFGIYVDYPNHYADLSNTKWDWINGNVFSGIGFEDIKFPISLFHCSFCSFQNLRLSNGITGALSPSATNKTYIAIKCSKFLTFDIKSHFPYKYLKTDYCHHIELKRCFTDTGLGDGQDYSRLLVLNEAGSALTGATYKFLSSAITSRNDCKHLYFGNDKQSFPDCVIPYHELFPRLDDIDDTRILSSQCRIDIQNQLEVTITFNNSLSHIHPELIIHLKNGGNQGKLIFDVTDPVVLNNPSVGYPVKVVGQADGINYVQQSGSYRVCYDHNNKLYVIPLST